MNKVEHRKMWLEQAGQLVASSLSVREWCNLNHLAESTMYVWLKVHREQVGDTRTARNDRIEISRAEVRQATALAVCDNTATKKPSVQPKSFSTGSTQTSMRVLMNNATQSYGSDLPRATRKNRPVLFDLTGYFQHPQCLIRRNKQKRFDFDN